MIVGTDVDWAPPGPGSWQQDSAHNPVSQTRIMQEVYPVGFNRGFEETFAAYGLLLDRIAMAAVNGFTYHQPQPFDLPGPDGPKDPAWIGAEFGRRVGVAEAAFAQKIWRDVIRRWDAEIRPALISRHSGLDVELGSLDDAGLRRHIDVCLDHVAAMVYEHHRLNAHAMVPVGDFLLRSAAWLHRDPLSLLAVFDGYSPVSNVSPPEMQPALTALRANPAAIDLLRSGGEAGAVLAQVQQMVPAVADYVASVHYRLLEGFDIINPTVGERPEGVVGRLAAALDLDPEQGRRRAEVLAAELRAVVPAEHLAEFDELLAEARLVYRLRDERGVYTDVSSIGLLRLGLLELGRRLAARGRLTSPDDVLDASIAEIGELCTGAASPSADELHQRGIDRLELTLAGAPRILGDPPHPPPPVDMLPPPLARVMSAMGFLIDGVLGQLPEAQGGDGVVIGIPGAGGTYEGTARLVHSIDDLFDLEQGEILIAPTTGEAFNSMLHMVGAIVTDHGSFASHAAIVGREMGIPAVVGTVDATRRISNGARIRVDGTTGTVTLLG
jgi:pyruvate,water dikinase